MLQTRCVSCLETVTHNQTGWVPDWNHRTFGKHTFIIMCSTPTGVLRPRQVQQHRVLQLPHGEDHQEYTGDGQRHGQLLLLLSDWPQVQTDPEAAAVFRVRHGWGSEHTLNFHFHTTTATATATAIEDDVRNSRM